MSTLDEHAKAGVAALERGDIAEAAQQLEQAVRLDPSRPDINHLYGASLLRRGEAGSAIDYLSKAVALAEPYHQPEYQDQKRDFRLALAAAHEMMDQTAAAREVLDQAVALWPASERPKLQLAQLLLAMGQLQEGLDIYRAMRTDIDADMDLRAAADALVGASEQFLSSGHSASIFIQGHQESYCTYFDEVTAEQVAAGWYAEAARMKRNEQGEMVPILAEGARPYALERVDLVNPADGTAAGVYSEQEPMIVAMSGLEPLAEVPILFHWQAQALDVWVSSRCPWHWLDLAIQFEPSVTDPIGVLEPVVSEWYLQGYNGDFGQSNKGRFHYITDLSKVGEHGVGYTVDLGRADLKALTSLLERLETLSASHPIGRVVIGQGKLLS